MTPPRVTLSLSKGALACFAALALAACQGGFGGTSAPGSITPPVNQQMPAQPQVTEPTHPPSPQASPSIPPGTSATYPFADGPKGLQCPQEQGFTCVLRFNVPNASPSPGASSSASASPSASASASPTPTPTPTPTPSPSPNGSASPSAHPSATPSGAQLTLSIAAMPKDAPAMTDPDPKAVATIALMSVRLRPSADVLLNGTAIAQFTLPKAQIGGRGFAVQLFHEQTKKKKTTETFFGSYSQSKLDKETLTFTLDVPKLQIKKDETWMLVLYGDERPDATPSASASPSSSASASSSPSASPSASPQTSATP